MLFQPFQKFRFYFIVPLAINFAGAVLTVAYHFKTKLIFAYNKFSRTNHLLSHVCRYKENSFFCGNNEVARKYHCIADANGSIKTHQHHFFCKRWMKITNE